jgi:hypothetical protein
LGFFKKIQSSDLFVFLDDVQYEKNWVQNRNKIRTSDGSIWLTVPVNASLDYILKDIKIENTTNWRAKHKKSIQINYSKTSYFKDFWPSLEQIYEKNFDFLVDVDMEIIKLLMKELQIKTKTIFSSELGISEKGSDKILGICKKLDADVYLSGILGGNYLNLKNFEETGIQVQFQNFQHPVYEQYYKPFLPNMASIDLIFNEGKNAPKILQEAKNIA